MNNGDRKVSRSIVIMMCGPAGSGKSTLARTFEQAGMTVLSYDRESFKRGWTVHPLPQEVVEDIKSTLDGRLIELLEKNRDVVLDYSFWSRESREEYRSLLRQYGVEPVIYYLKTPKAVVMARLNERRGTQANDMILSEETASFYFDHFQPPTDDEGCVIVVEGSEKRTDNGT